MVDRTWNCKKHSKGKMEEGRDRWAALSLRAQNARQGSLPPGDASPSDTAEYYTATITVERIAF